MSKRGKLGRRWSISVAIIVLVVGGVALASWLFAIPQPKERDLTGLTGDVARGAYVARLSGCIACHTDINNRGGILAGGAEIATDFGSFYAPNITPHPEDGIGKWSLEEFSRALTAGVSPDGNHYFPSFPYAFYKHLTDQDIVDLWAAVKSVPPVAGGPPEHDLQFPFGIRGGVAPWKKLYFDETELQPIPEKSKAWNRGRYIARGPGHCAACHTPRTLLGGRKADQRYEGGVGPDNEKIPPITLEALKKGGWTKEDLMFALRSGAMPNGDSFGGSMAELVRNGSRFWSNEDIEAVAEYLMSGDLR